MDDLQKTKIKLGGLIKRRREEIGMTMDELAQKMGYSHRSSIRKLESGENSIPLDKVDLLAESLRTTTAYLMGWEQHDITASDFAGLMYSMIEEHLDNVLPTDDEFELIAKYRKASDRDKALIDSILSEYT